MSSAVFPRTDMLFPSSWTSHTTTGLHVESPNFETRRTYIAWFVLEVRPQTSVVAYRGVGTEVQVAWVRLHRHGYALRWPADLATRCAIVEM